MCVFYMYVYMYVCIRVLPVTSTEAMKEILIACVNLLHDHLNIYVHVSTYINTYMHADTQTRTRSRDHTHAHTHSFIVSRTCTHTNIQGHGGDLDGAQA